MKPSKRKIIPIVLLVLGTIVATINPRIRAYDGNLFAISCTSKVTFVNNKMFSKWGVTAGFDTTKGLADKLVTGLKKDINKNPSGFNYIFEQAIENRREGLIAGISQRLESICTSKPEALEFQSLR